ncbi:MAG: HAMP domain-containing protein [Sphingomonadales bacterium]|nr:HAMP domain-containing protein [Sphingomonadales bacterium]
MAVTSPTGNRRWPRWWRRFQLASRRANVFAILEAVCVLAFAVMTLVTWTTLTSQSDKATLLPSSITASLLIGTLVPAMGLLVLLGRRMALRRAAESIGGSGKMHVRLVFLFSMIAAVPTLLVVIFASWLFQSGVEFWFSDNSRGMLENANKLARGYYEQNVRDVNNETVAMASDLRYILSETPVVSPAFSNNFSYQVIQRKLDEVAIVQKGADGKIQMPAVYSGPSARPTRELVSTEQMRRIDAGEPIVIEADANRIEAVTPIDLRAGIYLYAARKSDLLALSQGRAADNIVKGYRELTQRARVLQLRFNVALFVASLALVGLAVWFGLRFADRQVMPLYELVSASREVGAGNYRLRVEGRTGADEIGQLNRAFNRMTAQIERQTQALLGANEQLSERRAFIEAVLESVTAGVVSLDAEGGVQLMNSSAQKLLLGRTGPAPVGEKLSAIAPQIAAMIDGGVKEGVVQHGTGGGDLRTLAVKSTGEGGGLVITFEDITRQLLDQRQAAWSDVARRIAHEIKNPLTPIQLATERLNRRYRKQITNDPELFEELTSTIIRQVGDLRKMVDEFSSFARLPKPVFRGEDPVDLARQALFLQEVARPDIDFDFTSTGDIGIAACDRHQFGQAMTNVLKNAVEAVEAKARNAEPDYRGHVAMAMTGDDDAITVAIADNGIGLPQDRERIVEPYVTTREKGTGLGLAIVKKIVEEHGGEMTFTSGEGGGTVVAMRFARDPLSQQRGSEAAQ